jgi:hypothetical protein
MHAPVGPGTHHETAGELGEHFLEILEYQAMTIFAPPIGNNRLRQDDDVLDVLSAIDNNAAEIVTLNRRHLHLLGITVSLSGAGGAHAKVRRRPSRREHPCLEAPAAE